MDHLILVFEYIGAHICGRLEHGAAVVGIAQRDFDQDVPSVWLTEDAVERAAVEARRVEHAALPRQWRQSGVLSEHAPRFDVGPDVGMHARPVELSVIERLATYVRGHAESRAVAGLVPG